MMIRPFYKASKPIIFMRRLKMRWNLLNSVHHGWGKSTPLGKMMAKYILRLKLPRKTTCGICSCWPVRA